MQWIRVLLRQQLQDPNFVYLRAGQVYVECEPPASVQLDGDYLGRTPVDIRVLPAAVQVIRPG
jgi:diacylglycerol kinase family enzyme